MPPPLSQDNRIAKLHSPYPTDELLLVRFDGVEGVNQISEYNIEAICAHETVDLEEGIGKPTCIEIETLAGGSRFFSGLLVEAEWLRAHHYRLIVRSSLWLLSLRRNMHIFKNMTPEDIIRQILGNYDITSEFSLSPTATTLEYAVQFGETDLEFITRLMSRFGMSYCFRSTMNADKMVITNHMDGFPKIPGDSRKFVDVQGIYEPGKGEYLFGFQSKRKLTTGKVTLTDYSMIAPTTSMAKEATASGSGPHRVIEAYDSPAPFVYPPDSGVIDATIKLEKVRLDQYRSEDHRFVGRGDLASLQAGERVKIEDITDPSFADKTYLAVRHSFSCAVGSLSSGGSLAAGSEAEPFLGTVEFVSCDHPFAPPLVRPNRIMDGIQTAKVVGSSEIDVDEWGRILVCFPWDREVEQSIRVRVAQLWAGAQWGGIHIPRVGMEVVVQFVDGDVDKPMVTGCVYNEVNRPPFPLPDEQNLSGIKSQTVGGTGYNEYVFDDTSGAELIRQHAQFDMATVVENNETREIKKDRTTDVLQNDKLNVTQNLTVTVEQNEEHKVTQNFTVTADASIKLKCGSSEIEMTPTGITIKALSIDVKATAALTSSGLTAEHKASAMMTIKGVMVMIN